MATTTTVPFHDLTPTIGGCGRFQVTITMTVHAVSVMAAWSMIFMMFGAYNPGWTCLDDEMSLASNTTKIKHLTLSSSIEYEDSVLMMTNSIVGQDNVTFWSTDCAIKDRCQNILYNQDSSTVVTEWNLTCGSGWVSSVIISIEMVGVLLGSYVGGHLGDKFGRKVSLYSHLGFLGVCHLVIMFSKSWQMYAAIFCLIGFNVGGILSCSFHYPLEFVTEKWRGFLAALPIWNAGCTAFAVVVIILRDWRNVHLTTAVISMLLFLTVFWTPESVRWLAVSGKVNKAKRVVAKIARMNSRPCPNTHIIDAIANEEMTHMSGHKYTYLDLFRIKAIRYHSIKFGLIWMILAITYYAMSFGIKSLSGNFYMNLVIFSIFELPGMLLVAPAVNILGRRKAALMYFALEMGCAFSLVIVSFTTSGNVKDTCTLVLALTCKMIIVSAWAVVTVFSSELFPTVVRSLHYGFINAASRLGVMVSPYIIPDDSDNIYMAFFIIGVLIGVNFCLIWSLPETKGRPLQDRPRIDNLEALQDGTRNTVNH